jgi:hypothetical protein
MQGNWTVKVKSKSAAFPQQFKIIGAATGNGTYNGLVATPPVNVTGQQWSIAILNNAGNGFISSTTRLKFPQKIGGNYVFDIESNDAGGDADFDDLILTCSTPATLNDFIVYGNVTLYDGPCLFNPCFIKWLIIDSYDLLLRALDIPALKDVIQKIYPERIPPIRVNPNPPDPIPFFKPMMINLVDDVQIPPKQAQLFKQIELPADEIIKGKKGKTMADVVPENLLSSYKIDKLVTSDFKLSALPLTYDKANLARFIEPYKRFICNTEPAANQTLSFDEYDRSLAELAGNPYTGSGDHLALGNTITDVNGNYIFRFTQGWAERFREYFVDYASGEDHTIQILPDVIVKVEQLSPVYKKLYETVPYFNIGNLKQINICMPKSKVPPVGSFCFNGNIIDKIGNVFIGGAQNNAASFATAALDRNGLNNHLRANGVISVNTSHAANPSSVFSVDCACWGNVIDVKGCLFNMATIASAGIKIHHYTIRYKKSSIAPWQYVTETMLHPLHHKNTCPPNCGYIGDQFGPFTTNLNVDGGGLVMVPAYKNIQREAALALNDWEAGGLDTIIRLNTNIYQGSAAGTVYFRIDGYDETGAIVPNSTDMIALYIDNNPLDFGLANIAFPPSIEYVVCGLYKMTDAQLNTELAFSFKAADLLNDPINSTLGFVNDYSLSFSKCPSPMALDMSTPVIKNNITDGVLAYSPAIVSTETGGCVGYKGTITDFGTVGYINTTIKPNGGAGWLSATEPYGVFNLQLSANRRVTNGYNSGIEGTYVNTGSFSIIKK